MSFVTGYWLVLVTVPHILYFFAYHYGQTLNKWIPHAEFVNLAILFRAISILTTCILFKETFFYTWEFYEWFSPFPLVFVGLLLLLLGLQLNLSVYQKLGVSGVYYSCEMIQECKRVEGYPFTAISHPMYVGAILILLGCIFLFGAEYDYYPRPPIIIPLVYMFGLYLVTMYAESQPTIQKMKTHTY